MIVMKRKRPPHSNARPVRWYRGADVPMRVIRHFARQVAERFDPDEIILFGSYAHGTPHADSDVDVLVIMPARNQLDQAVKIELACDPPFPLDIIVRTPHNMRWRLAEGDSFLREITTRGKILYEKNDAALGAESRKRLPNHTRPPAFASLSEKAVTDGLGLDGRNAPAQLVLSSLSDQSVGRVRLPLIHA
jgi:predicted nucleotidyltransferase